MTSSLRPTGIPTFTHEPTEPQSRSYLIKKKKGDFTFTNTPRDGRVKRRHFPFLVCRTKVDSSGGILEGDYRNSSSIDADLCQEKKNPGKSQQRPSRPSSEVRGSRPRRDKGNNGNIWPIKKSTTAISGNPLERIPRAAFLSAATAYGRDERARLAATTTARRQTCARFKRAAIES